MNMRHLPSSTTRYLEIAMDRTISIRMYRVERRENRGPSFSEALDAIIGRRLGNREYEVEPDVIVRLERLQENRRIIRGEFVRLQSENLPAKALRAHPAERLGVDSIGHSTVFAYDRNLSVLSMQFARNGISATRIGLYASYFSHTDFDLWPIPNEHVWGKLRGGHIRAMRVRLASPDNLESADQETRTIKQGLQRLKDATETKNLEVSFSMSRGDPDLNRARTLRFFRWFSTEREANRGDVSRLTARVSDGEETEILNLIGAQMGAKRKLDLPKDDPSASYEMRVSYAQEILQENRRRLEADFG